MKKVFFLIAMFFALTLSAQVKVGDNPTTVHSSAMLQVDSSTKGFLPPRMTNAQMTAIASPANGLMVYCTNCSPAGLYTYSGSAWSAVGDTSSGGSSSSGGVSASMAFTTGTYIWGGPSVTRNIVITIVNNSFSTVAWTNANTNLVLTGNSGVTVGTPSPASTSIASGGTGTITFPVTGVVGTMDDITATWTKLALTVVGTQAITPGSATFTDATNNAFVFSANASGVNVAGTIPSGTSILLPYTAGVGKYENYVSPEIPIPSQYCNDGSNNWTFSYTYPEGTFSSTGNLTAYIYFKKGGVDTPWPAFQVTNIATINFNCVTAPLVVNGATLSNTIGIDEGGDAIRGQLTTRAAAYDAAIANNWVPISTAEYNLLLTNVPGANKYMMQNTAATSVGTITANQTMVPANYYVSGYLVPNNSYVFAIAVKMGVITAANPFAGSTIRFNSGAVNGASYSVLGNSSIVTHYSAEVGGANYHWVLKRPSQKTTTNSFISFYSPNHSIMNVGDLTNSTYRIATGSLNNMSTSTTSQGSPMIQVLATTTKSW